MRILIADDEPNVRSALRLLLEQLPDMYVAGEVADDRELLKWLKANQSDLLLLDWELPGRGAEGLILVLRALYRPLHIVVLDSRPQARHEALAAGADDFVSKNDPPEALVTVLANVYLRHIENEVKEADTPVLKDVSCRLNSFESPPLKKARLP